MTQLIIHYLAGYTFFLAAIFFSFFIPGNLFVSSLRIKSSGFFSNIVSWFAGCALFILLSYFSAYVNLPKLPIVVLILISVIWVYYQQFTRRFKKISFKKVDVVSVILIIIGSIAFTLLMFFSGFTTQNGLQFFATNSTDGIRHIAYITDQVSHFPPQEPGVSGQPLLGFHYFYDFTLSRFALFYSFSVQDLYFRFFPLFISALYGLSFVLFANTFFFNNVSKRFLLFLVYFSRSSGVVLSLFTHKISLSDNVLLQPLGLIENPFTVFSIGILICSFTLFPFMKKSWKYSLIIGLLLGVLSQIKVYAGLIGIVALIGYSIYLVIRYKKAYIFSIGVSLVLTAIITIITYFPNNLGAGSLIFAPLLFYEHYMQSGYLNVINGLQWQNRLVTYEHYGQYWKVILLYSGALFLFVVINFGLRLAVFYKIKTIFSKSFWKKDENVILFCALGVAFIIPSFFIQSISVFDIIQFFWIAMVLLCIPTAIVLADVYVKLPRCTLKYFMILLILWVSISGVRSTENNYLFKTPAVVFANADLQTFAEVTKIVPENGFITLVPPTKEVLKNYPFPILTPFVAALTQRQIYYEDGWLPTIDAIKYEKRAKQIQQLQLALVDCSSSTINALVKKIGSPYIITIGDYSCINTLLVKKRITTKNGFINFYQISLK